MNGTLPLRLLRDSPDLQKYARELERQHARPRIDPAQWLVETPPTGAPWLAVATDALMETTVAEALDKARYVVYLPREVVRERHGRNRWRDVPRPVFRGYLFVQVFAVPQEQVFYIKAERGVRDVLRPTVNDRYSLIPDAFMRGLRYRLGDDEPVVAPKDRFDVGETVRVTDGPFASFGAVIEEILKLDAYGRISVLKAGVEIFGRTTPVELNVTQIAKL